ATQTGETFFSTSHDIPHTPPIIPLHDGDLTLPPPLTPSSVPLRVFPTDTLSLIPAPPRYGHVIAPCPHDSECPMYNAAPVTRGLIQIHKRPKPPPGERVKTTNRRDESLKREKIGIQGTGGRKWWCHFQQKLQNPQIFEEDTTDDSATNEEDNGTELSKYSYVV